MCVWEREIERAEGGEESYIDLHITNSINRRRIQTKHRSRKRLHQKHLLSCFSGFCFVMAPHQPHLKIGELDGRRRRNPQPQHVSSWSSLIVVIECSYYKTFPLATIFKPIIKMHKLYHQSYMLAATNCDPLNQCWWNH